MNHRDRIVTDIEEATRLLDALDNLYWTAVHRDESTGAIRNALDDCRQQRDRLYRMLDVEDQKRRQERAQ